MMVAADLAGEILQKFVCVAESLSSWVSNRLFYFFSLANGRWQQERVVWWMGRKGDEEQGEGLGLCAGLTFYYSRWSHRIGRFLQHFFFEPSHRQ